MKFAFVHVLHYDDYDDEKKRASWIWNQGEHIKIIILIFHKYLLFFSKKKILYKYITCI
jgi:hypothetical protein